MKNYYLTSESVTEGHPDKICDKISDYILDEALKQDKNSKMAVEATIKDDLILIYGEATTNAKLNYEQLAKQVLKEIGYTEEYNVIVKVNKQSIEINNAVNKDKIMAGDQGIMFGYATNETKEYIENIKKEIEGENYIPNESAEDFIARMHKAVEEGKRKFEAM